jgi:hypothetical protein
MSNSSSKIAVDHRGLQRIVRERGEVTLLDELVQNALDTDATEVTIEISSPGNNRVQIVVTDNDPVGYVDLTHAYTLFAPSVKRDDATKRGFMNVGDKLAIAFAVEGQITSTSGTVVIDGDERKPINRRKRTDVGSVVDLTFPLSKVVMAKMLERARTYLIPDGVIFTVNGEVVPTAKPKLSTSARLRLYVGVDEDGETVMRERERVTQLDLYEPDARGSWIYVLGIPVQEIEDFPLSVDVRGRLKADVKRDQVPARELHRIHVAVADAIADELTHADVTGWARSTMADASPAVVQRIVTETFGADAMVADPSDQEANIRATEEGRTLIPARAFARDEWTRVRELRSTDANFAPTTSSEYGSSIEGFLDEAIDPALWTPRATEVVEYARRLFARLAPGATLNVTITGGAKAPDCMAAMGRHGSVGSLTINKGSVGWDWFEDRHAVLDTLIHEFAHYFADGHGHSIRWGESCADIGARIALWGDLP